MEPRLLLAAAPFAGNDSLYYTAQNTDLIVTLSSSPAHLLANDFDADGGSISASIVTNPTSGTLVAFNANGTFTYRPNTSFVGVDSFFYKLSDGTNDSNIAKATIAIGTKLLGPQSFDGNNLLVSNSGAGPGSDLKAGSLSLGESLVPGMSLIYRSDALTRPILIAETQLAPTAGVPAEVSAQLTFNGTAGTTYTYSTSGMAAGQAMRIALQADGSSLTTGMYDYSISIGTKYGTVWTYQTFTGKQSIVNRSASEFGNGWWLDGLSTLKDSAAGALLVRGNGDTLWFPKSGSTYLHAAGDTDYGTLVKNGNNTFTLTEKNGLKHNFSTTGLLTSLVDLNNNTTSFAYADRDSDGVADELISVTDPFGRVTSFNYTSGKLSSVAHYSGRTTTLSITSGKLNSITSTDPDGGGPLSSPVTLFGYNANDQVSSRTNSVNETTRFSYHATDRRLRTITHPDTKTWQLLPVDVIGLPTGTSGNPIKKPVDAQGTVTDELNNVWKFRLDRFGQVTQWTTALGFVTDYTRNADGQAVIEVLPDPDGAGAMSSSVRYYAYNASDDLTYHRAADTGATHIHYSATLHQVLSVVDPMNRTQSFTYDVFGNMLTSVDGGGFTTTYAYNSRGLPTNVTPPDPDGAGPLVSPVTQIAYDTLGRATTITNPDSSTQSFTYNSADQVLTHVDELNKTTTMGYDSLGRMTSITNRLSALTQFSYDAMSRKIQMTDAIGNVTDYAYSNRGWLVTTTYPDADGAGPLARAINTISYDAVGNVIGEGVSDNNYQSSYPYTYDADRRFKSRALPGGQFIPEQYTYDQMGRVIKVMDPNLNERLISYDAESRVTNKKQQGAPSGQPTIYTQESFGYNLAGELVSQTDGRGNTTLFGYNSRGLLASETLPDPDSSGSQFGRVVTHLYDNMGRETSVNLGYGRTITQEYNSRSWVTKTTDQDPDGAGPLTAPVIQFGYNLRGDRTSQTDPLGRVTTLSYDNEQQLVGVTRPDPDGAGPLTAPVMTAVYNAVGWMTSLTDPRGGVTSYAFDSMGRLLTKTDPDPDGAGPLTAPVTTQEYNAQGLWKVTDALTRVTTLGRDSAGRITSLTDPIGNVTSYEYNFYNNMTKKEDPDPDGAGPLTKLTTSYNYDPAQRVTSKNDPMNGVTAYSYDQASNLTQLIDPVGNLTSFAYNGQNQLVIETNALSKSKTYVYDVGGNLTRTVDRNGKTIQYLLDGLDRVIEEKWQDNASPVPTLTVSTTQEGGPINEVQRVGYQTSAYSVSGTFTLTHNGQTTSALSATATAAQVDAALEALSSIGAGNVNVELLPPVNTLDRVFKITFVGSKSATNVPQTMTNVGGLSTYPAGTPTTVGATDATGGTYTEVQSIVLANSSGGTWRLAYNGEVTAPLSPSATAAQVDAALEALQSIDLVTVTGSSGSFTVTFAGSHVNQSMMQIFGDAATASSGSTVRTITTAYNAASEITQISDPGAAIGYTRDNLGRATAITNTIAGLTPVVVFNQAFDAASNRTELKATIGGVNDFKNTYQYDALQRMTDLVQQGQSGGNAVTAKHLTFAYNGLHQRTNFARYQSTGTSNAVATTDATYDSANRLASLTHKQGATTLSGYTYGYDSASRLTSVQSTIEGLSTISYDATSQVVGADHSSQTDETYSYDLNGNRNSSGYTTATNNQTTAGGGFTYVYDDEGNRISRAETATGKVQEYTWDYRNRLVTVKDRNSSGGAVVKQVDYVYDALNRLVKRSFDADGAGSGAANSQYWAYDESINALLQFDGSASTNLSHRYLWSGNVDELMADEIVTSLGSGGNVQWPLGDHLGTLRDIADLNEGTGVTAVTNHRTYNAYGKLVSETNSAVDLIFGFTGKQLDDATGLQHNLFRWYDSALGQWLSEDPLGFAAGDENLSRYVANDILQRVDNFGLEDSLGSNPHGPLIPDAPTYNFFNLFSWGDYDRSQRLQKELAEIKNRRIQNETDTFLQAQMVRQQTAQDYRSAAYAADQLAQLEFAAITAVGNAHVKLNLQALAERIAAEELSDIARLAQTDQDHHAIPKFLGGWEKQDLLSLDTSIHTEYHKLLRLMLAQEFPYQDLKFGIGSYENWMKHFSANQGAQMRAFDCVRIAAELTDKKYGTEIATSFEENFRQGRFTAPPATH